MNQISKRLKSITNQSNPEIVELVFGSALFLWGVWVLLPIWETFESGPTFAVIRSLKPPFCSAELFWGVVVGGGGALQLVALIRNSIKTREIMAPWNMVALVFLGVVLVLGNTSSPALVWFGCFAWAEYWAYSRIHEVNHNEQ